MEKRDIDVIGEAIEALRKILPGGQPPAEGPGEGPSGHLSLLRHKLDLMESYID